VVTVSIGVAGSRGGGGLLDDLIGAADQALYVAKCAGRNRVAGLHLVAS
jgi:PleD family two-component response regulator